MIRHKIPDLLRDVQGHSLPVSPLPLRFWRHTEMVDPVAEAYAALYQTRYGFAVKAEALERFLDEVDG